MQSLRKARFPLDLQRIAGSGFGKLPWVPRGKIATVESTLHAHFTIGQSTRGVHRQGPGDVAAQIGEMHKKEHWKMSRVPYLDLSCTRDHYRGQHHQQQCSSGTSRPLDFMNSWRKRFPALLINHAEPVILPRSCHSPTFISPLSTSHHSVKSTGAPNFPFIRKLQHTRHPSGPPNDRFYHCKTSMSSPTTSPSPLRIACLHGFRQNAQLFRRKTGGLRKSLERDISLVQGGSSKSRKGPRMPMAQLHYLNAPFILERIEKDLAIDHTSEHQGRAYFRAVYSPREAHSAGEGSTESQENDATERTWLMAEGTEYVGWDKTFHFLRDQFAERVSIHLHDNVYTARTWCHYCSQTASNLNL